MVQSSDSALTAEMFWGSFGGLSVLKLMLFQSKAAATHNDTSLVDSNFKNAIPDQKWNHLRNRPHSIVYII